MRGFGTSRAALFAELDKPKLTSCNYSPPLFCRI
jgi:hypothetical protein